MKESLLLKAQVHQYESNDILDLVVIEPSNLPVPVIVLDTADMTLKAAPTLFTRKLDYAITGSVLTVRSNLIHRMSEQFMPLPLIDRNDTHRYRYSSSPLGAGTGSV